MGGTSLERREDYQVRGPYRRTRRPEERVTLLGQAMDLVKPEEMLHFLQGAIDRRDKVVIAHHNLHSLHLVRKNAAMAALYARAALVQVDGLPLTLWARAIYGHGRRFHRSTYMDFRTLFWDLAQARGWRVFYLGGAPGVLEGAKVALHARWPRALIEGRHGYFTPGGADEAKLIADIAAFRPDVLMVGMGMPVQEAWIERNHDRLPACAILPIGAAFDYEAGAIATPPSWTGRLGLEWAWRLVSEPRRLAVRYLVEPWSLVRPALGDLIGRRRLRARHGPASRPATATAFDPAAEAALR